MGKLAPELIWALRQQALWGREQEADKTTPGQKENTSWPLLLGVMVLLMIVMMMMRRRRKKEHYGHFLKGSWCCCWWFWWRGVPWLMGMESHSRSNGNRQAVTKRIKQAEPWQRENRDRCSLSFSSSSSYLTMLMMGYCDEGGSLGNTWPDPPIKRLAIVRLGQIAD